MKSLEALFGPNSALVEELFEQYKSEPDSVPAHWQNYFDELTGTSTTEKPTPKTTPQPSSNGSEAADPVVMPAKGKVIQDPPKNADLQKIKGVASKIVENMDESLEVPTATSLRVLPVKMMIEDRTIINRHLVNRNEPKASFTHFICWAVIQALKEFPTINHSYYFDGKDHFRAVPEQVNLGVAVDLPNKDGSRNLVVPNIKGVDKMNFKEFLYAFADLVDKARNGKLGLDDFQGTTISITNPGTLGTVSSVPRLMQKQGAIIATGAIDYPAEYQAMSQQALNHLGISKVMTMTCTYDHRIIQGAESGAFLQKVNQLLTGQSDFWTGIFTDLEIPYEPIPYGEDKFEGMFGGASKSDMEDRRTVGVWRLINMYRMRGHVLANLDPLEKKPGHNPELDLEYYGLSLWDLDREFFCGKLFPSGRATLREIIRKLRDTYCEHIGAEYMHLLDMEERRWLRENMESTGNEPDLTKEDKKEILHKLNQAMAFEEFLHKKYIGHKRFSLEGNDTLIPMIHFMLEKAGQAEIEKVFMGMAHRGRLNILVNIMNKPYHRVFAEFEGNVDPDTIQGSGDVKYHLGARGKHKSKNGAEVDIELLPNPSHLEAVNPVVEGAARAVIDHHEKEDAEKRILPVLMHGDAAFAGQGVVAETLNLSQLDGYRTGGTVHIIINNQIGFTTLPEDGRSTEYASDLAKTVLAPIFHVNGDRPEAAVHAIQMALAYRQKFGKDVIIDLIGYRKHGHNEGDEPAFTQPGMYKEINDHQTVRDLYTNSLVKAGELTEEETQQIFDEFDELLQGAFEDAKKAPSLKEEDAFFDRVEMDQEDWSQQPDTTTTIDDLKEIAVKINTVPKDFDANPKLLRQLAKRAEIVQNNEKKIDWGFAEALAFGTLLKAGRTVRITGQDVERGTFAHRHAVLHGTETNQTFTPLNNLSDDQAEFHIHNSLLSEYAALGFEFGYSATKKEALVIWEAQFGDFANGAQIIIDQFLASSEAKWGQTCSMVLNLPHGYEGQGPEHSSARLERFLQLCAEDNMYVMNLTTPAQYFHMLRKQTLMEKFKPTVLMSPKSLLRHPMATSKAEDLGEGRFQPFIKDETNVETEKLERLVICSGKVYYDLLKYQQENEIDKVAIARLEQIYPFPDKDVKQYLASMPNVKEIVWCQEEPKNMGAWTFVATRFMEEFDDGQRLIYAGRQASASPAAGQKAMHDAEQQKLVEEAMKL
ncbi:MAG: multifunctional oxoglutarate decarboxylase/oxoglutarate dehydrogenase thiamine pyrophosphate-binding subunit/dihydrolipoyllysine-residue succinyltransferase subunit [Balneolaceae bacterium]|nr:multifunctional oxoglutarate decarboxylase/oxoglutarate dehydrogenase thiamine pyrophosphate-binding subunit/dihydrolipoyllysine-residue succinyltransferase subunit [Balneolaceae bacterium]